MQKIDAHLESAKLIDESLEKEILRMSPPELVSFLAEQEQKGQLNAFLLEASQNDALVAEFSYVEKLLKTEIGRLLDQIIKEKKEQYGQTENLPLKLDKKYSPEELKIMLPRLKAIQLTFGCSKGCPLCGFDAVPGVRDQFDYSAIANLLQQYSDQLKIARPFFYWASETSDHPEYQNIHELAESRLGYSPNITTREVNDPAWLEFLGNNKSQTRISLYELNAEKGDQIETTIKTFNKQIEILGKNEHHRPGIGKSFKPESSSSEKKIYKAGIGCINGLLLSPRGLYSVVQLPLSARYPQGQIVQPFKKLQDITINPGDNLSDILQSTISLTDFNLREETYYDPQLEMGVHKLEGENFSKKTFLRGQSKVYKVIFDEDGIVTQSQELSLKEYYKKSEPFENKLRRNLIIEKKLFPQLNEFKGKALVEKNLSFPENLALGLTENKIIGLIQKTDLTACLKISAISDDSFTWEGEISAQDQPKLKVYLTYHPEKEQSSLEIFPL